MKCASTSNKARTSNSATSPTTRKASGPQNIDGTFHGLGTLVTEAAVHHVYFVPGMFGFGHLAGYDYFKHLRAGLEQRFAAAGIPARFEDVPAPPTSSAQFAQEGDQ